jgi:predicted metal-dependent hydrolase
MASMTFSNGSRMDGEIIAGGYKILITRKNVRNLNLRLHIRTGEIKLSVPQKTPGHVISAFISEKLPWIRKHFRAASARPKIIPNKYNSGELIPVWGEKLELDLQFRQVKKIEVHRRGPHLVMHVPVKSCRDRREKAVFDWYRAELNRSIPQLIEKYEPIMGVSVNEFGVRRMKTRWGSCNTKAKRIWLNLNLAERPPILLEYVVVHEMVHLLERGHNRRFYSYMDRFMPHWREYDKMLKNS